jgi:hypothetical protein
MRVLQYLKRASTDVKVKFQHQKLSCGVLGLVFFKLSSSLMCVSCEYSLAMNFNEDYEG